MPTSYEIRTTAWGKMRDGGFLPIIAGFALVFMLGTLVDVAIRQFGLWQGFIANVPALDFIDQTGLVLEPEHEKALGSLTIPQIDPAYGAAVLVAKALWKGILAFGCAVIAISVMRGGATAFQVLLGFRWPVRTASLGLLRSLLIFLWSLLLIVPGVCAAYSYRMAFYLLADNPDWTPWRAIQESKKLMYGHRWRLACMDFSFIGWFLLVVATWGLAGIFVMPYFAAANAAFYEDLLDRTEH